MQNIFEIVKSVVTPRQAAEAYGLTAHRNDMARCPFHNDKTPSMKLYEDHFYCFGCGAAGRRVWGFMGIEPLVRPNVL